MSPLAWAKRSLKTGLAALGVELRRIRPAGRSGHSRFSNFNEEDVIGDLLHRLAVKRKFCVDIGAGDGSHAVAVARLVGPGGEVLATDLDPDRRRAIADRAAREHSSNVRVIEAARDTTNLPDGCCQAIYMRTMFHHLADPTATDAPAFVATDTPTKLKLLGVDVAVVGDAHATTPGAQSIAGPPKSLNPTSTPRIWARIWVIPPKLCVSVSATTSIIAITGLG